MGCCATKDDTDKSSALLQEQDKEQGADYGSGKPSDQAVESKKSTDIKEEKQESGGDTSSAPLDKEPLMGSDDNGGGAAVEEAEQKEASPEAPSFPVPEYPPPDQKPSCDLTPEGAWPMPGECLLERTLDLKKDLELLKEKFGDKYEPLLERKWKTMAEITGVEEVAKKHDDIVIMQFNTLADGLSNSYLKKSDAKTFLGVDKECLRWTYRGLRLVEAMLDETINADIICLEEVDQIDFFRGYLESNGYQVLFQPKMKSPTRHVAEHIAEERNLKGLQLPKDGVAIAFKSDRFISSNIQHIDMSQNDHGITGLVVQLREKTSEDDDFLVVCTHLKSTKSADGEQIREKQVQELLEHLVANEEGHPIILGCDLNATPTDAKYDPLCYKAVTEKLGYVSAYKNALGAEPEYTTWKLREHGTDRHTIDYIFMSRDMFLVNAVLTLPLADEDTKGFIPSWAYPSDHFAIACKLTSKPYKFSMDESMSHQEETYDHDVEPDSHQPSEEEEPDTHPPDEDEE